VLSGKYSAVSEKSRLDPRAQLEAMAHNYETRRATIELGELQKQLVDAQRTGDRKHATELAMKSTLHARLVDALKKGDRETVAVLRRETSNGKQVD
jgi:hypothetical protein